MKCAAELKKIVIEWIREHIKLAITAIVSVIGLAIWKAFKPWLKVNQSFTIPRWGWVLVFVAPAVVAVLIFAAITNRLRRHARSHLLDGTKDICMALVRWIVDRCKEALTSGAGDIGIITVKYDDVDKECGLVPGTAKDYLLPGVEFLIESGFPVRAGLPGEKTITISFGKNLADQQEDLEFDQASGTYISKTDGLRYCHKCWNSFDKRVPLKEQKNGWQCSVCNKFYRNPHWNPPRTENNDYDRLGP